MYNEIYAFGTGIDSSMLGSDYRIKKGIRIMEDILTESDKRLNIKKFLKKNK